MPIQISASDAANSFLQFIEMEEYEIKCLAQPIWESNTQIHDRETNTLTTESRAFTI